MNSYEALCIFTSGDNRGQKVTGQLLQKALIQPLYSFSPLLLSKPVSPVSMLQFSMTRLFMNCFHVQSLATTLTLGEVGPFTSEYLGFDQSSNNFWPRLWFLLPRCPKIGCSDQFHLKNS